MPSRSSSILAIGVLLAAGGGAGEPNREAFDRAELGLPLQRYHSSEDYHGYSQATAIAHTAEGFAVIGSYGAVFVYDGHTYEKIPLAASFVTALHLAADGVVWAACDNEIGVLATDPTTQAWRFESRTALLPVEARSFGRVRQIVHARGVLWAATTRGLLRLADGRAELLSFGAEARLQVFALGDRIYVQDSLQGLLRHDGRAFVPVETGESLVNRSIQLAPWSDTQALCLVSGLGAFTLDLASGRLAKLATPLEPMLQKISISQILRLRDGRYALVRAGSGALLLADRDLQGGQIIDQTAGLPTSVVFGASLDAEDGLWLGLANGVTRLDVAPGLTVFDERTGIRPGSAVDVVRQDGRIYAGTSDGVLRLEPGDPTTGRIARFAAVPLFHESCMYIAASRRGLVVGGGTSVDLLAGETRRQLLDPRSSINSVQRSTRQPDVYFVSADNGCYVLDLATGASVRIPGLPTDTTLWNFLEAADGSLWAGSRSDGLWRITPAPGGDWAQARLEHFAPGEAGLPRGKSWTAPFALFGEPFFLSDLGTHRWDAGARTFPIERRFRAAGGDHLRFFPVLADAGGRAWTSLWFGTLTCSRPLGYFAAESTGGFLWHDAPARWSAGVGRWGAQRMLLEEGREKNAAVLWTKSLTTLARFEMTALSAATPAAPWRPVLRAFTAADRVWPSGGQTALRLPFSNAPITLHYAAPRFRPGANVRYETRLIGFRDTWSPPSEDNETVFTNLSGGPFTFEVRARDGDNLVSEVTQLAFAVSPPWFRSPLAFVLYLAALGTAIFALLRWRLGRVERERSRLEQVVAERTRELAAARDQAEAASRAKSSFLAAMSHELRTPLNGVIGYAQVLQDDRRLLADQRERLRIVQHSGEHLLRMINDVLDLAKIEAGKLELRPESFLLGDLVRDIMAAHAPAAAAKRLAFTAELAPELPAWVEGDAQKLRQVLDNLLGNAVKFTASGAVTLRVSAAKSLVQFAVTDTGPGITAADQARLFQPFEQATRTRPNAPGAGLGLAISRALVERLGGALSLTSAPGRGSTFAFALPLPAVAPSAAAAPRERQLVGYVGRPRYVIIVDDHAVNRSLLTDLLMPLGFACTEFATGESALDRVARGATPWPDLAILDVRMEGLDGLELTRRLRALPRGAELKILLTSASVLTFDPAEGRRAGCDDFLPKPFRTGELVEKIGRLLSLSWRETEAEAASGAAAEPLPEAIRDELRECLAQGDLEAFRARLTSARAAHPAAESRWAELEAAAAAFELSRLRLLLEQP